ncbi:hypothetical protein J7J90_04740 [Candidatus Micrarchaeota archaeon]|nr:hypothetical protein [Candidatus Micrarchaeota archaeon]
MENVTIIADHREPDEIINELRNLSADVIVKQIELGDYLTSERTVIERKSKHDFEQSIIDQRLFRQMNNLNEWYENVIIIVEGTEPYLRLHRDAILGAYASIITDFHCSLFFTRNKIGTAEMIYAIAKHEQFAKRYPLNIIGKRKRFTLSEHQRAVIESLPKIGPQLAITLLKHFGSIDNIANATVDDLMKVKGIGKKKAEEIVKIMHVKFE